MQVKSALTGAAWRDGKQYVAIVAAGASALDDPAPAGAEALVVYSLP